MAKHLTMGAIVRDPRIFDSDSGTFTIPQVKASSLREFTTQVYLNEDSSKR